MCSWVTFPALSRPFEVAASGEGEVTSHTAMQPLRLPVSKYSFLDNDDDDDDDDNI